MIGPKGTGFLFLAEYPHPLEGLSEETSVQGDADVQPAAPLLECRGESAVASRAQQPHHCSWVGCAHDSGHAQNWMCWHTGGNVKEESGLVFAKIIC